MAVELRVERFEGVGLLTLTRPERLNALTLDMLYRGLPDAISELGSDDTVRAVVITGAEGGFCAGADLDSAAFDAHDMAEHVRRSHATPSLIHFLDKPVLAAVNGPAAGAGLGLALACDIRVASPTASFVAPFVQMGMTPDFGLTWSLPRAVGAAAAFRLLLTGESVSAQEALRLGIVSSVQENVVQATLELASRVSASGLSARLLKSSLRQAERASFTDTLFDIEPVTQAAAMRSSEFAELFRTHSLHVGRRAR